MKALLMAKRNEFLHNIAVLKRNERQSAARQSPALAKAISDAQLAHQEYLQSQTHATLALEEGRRIVQYQISLPPRESQAIIRKMKSTEKERQKYYTNLRHAEVNLANVQLDVQIFQLESLLKATLSIDDYFDLRTLTITPKIPQFVSPDVGRLPTKPDPQTYLPPPPKGIKAKFPGVKEKYRQEYGAARERYKRAFENYKQQMLALKAKVDSAKESYKQTVHEIRAQADAHNSRVDQFRKEFEAGRPDAITDYFMFVLEASLYPDNFPQHAKLAFIPESKQLVVEYDLPPFDVVPEIGSYKYIKTKDEIASSSRPASQRKSLYSSVIAQVAIRTIHELFEADRLGHLETIVFNGYVDSIDRGTGRTARECLVTVRVTREIFLELDLNRVDPIACLRVLNAGVSKAPEELAPVKPVVEFNMVDPRFVEETDVLSSLDQRPNLMELTPIEFESLIANLFEKMGLETRQTQASRDGGVDCVAWDPRPILGGKVVIQAKRYKHTVGVSAVRDLYGTLQNEGASKGILVTTSGYGKAAFEFASGKPIELLSGSNLLYLLETHADIKAKIVPPDTWKDPIPDSAESE